MAERILKGMLVRAKRLDITVLSAGMVDMHGAHGDAVAAAILTEHGFDGHFHVSRPYDDALLSRADWIVLMENSHKQRLLELYPQYQEKFHLLKTFSPEYDGVNVDIRDPYRQSSYHYRLCFAEIYNAVSGMMRCI